MSPSIEEIKEVLKIFLDSELQDLRLEIGDVRLAVSKSGAGAVQPFSAPAPRPSALAAPAIAPAAAAPGPAPAAVPAKPALAPKAIAEVPEGWVAVTAPSVGVFYRRPAPDQPPFVEVGSKVAANDAVCLIEVMKMFTSVLAPCKGRIAEILIEDASMVEHGQALMYIEPD
ncbi:MAG: acetyl-CoA carboxylase biotin carboxyl carrier protein [Betaproteobacteria bacterium]|nr:acetyl-CoA carboxylase biotin carboxyl carrier protein [Betaproteobacteria bacterium]MBI2961945.1 acetyl-CoA carboxylase biotin carboxyl carrier protein [Betaproteobacteria bacterium]